MNNRLRNIFLIFGLMQCFLLLANYIYLFFFKNDILLLVCYFYSLFLGFNIAKKKLQLLLANNAIVIFLSFIFLYGIFNSIIEILLEEKISQSTYIATLIYASSLPSFILGASVFSLKKSTFSDSYILSNKISFYKRKYNYFLLIVLLILVAYKSYDFYSQGILLRPSLLQTVSRFELFKENSQLTVVIGFLISGIFLYFVYYFKEVSIRIKLGLTIILIYYIAIQLSVGNRKEFVPIILGIFWVFVCIRNIKFTYTRFIILLILIFIFLFLGSIRGGLTKGDLNYGELALITLSNNEFVYPFVTLRVAVEGFLNGTINYLYGKSLLIYPFVIFIPRELYHAKFNSLALQFVLDNFGGGMGYAYSPVTEAFINLGIFGPAIIFFLLGIIIAKFQLAKDQRPIYIFFTMIPDFCRGEFSALIYQFVFVSLFILIIPSIGKIIFNLKVKE